MSAHAPFAPSSADRWMACPGSFGLSLQLPDPGSSEYADEGTRLHEVAAEYLQHGYDQTQPAPDDLAFLRPYIDHCVELITKAQWHAIETRIEHSQLLFGTADFMAGVDGALHVVDLKCGQGIMVRPDENKQLLTYAYMELKRSKPACKRVRLTIVQPYDTAEPVKYWDTTVSYVMAHGRAVEEAIQNALQGSSELVPGEHCRWCRAKPVCPRLRGLLNTLPASLQPSELQPALTAEILDRADLVLQFIDAVRTHAHSLALRGITVPGYVLKPKRAMRSWADADATLAWARKHGCIGQVTEKSLRSPAQVEKKNPALYARITDQVVAVSSGTNLVKGATEAPSAAIAQPSLAASLSLLKFRI